MARSPSITKSFLQMDKARRYISEILGKSTKEKVSAHNIELDAACAEYQAVAENLLREYLRVQNLADAVLLNSSDLEERQDVINQLFDFSLMVHNLSNDELYVFIKAGRENSLGEMLDLEQKLRENKNMEFDKLDKNLKSRLLDLIEYSFYARSPAGSNYEERQIGTSFIYSMLGVLNGIDMGRSAVVNVVEAKKRAGIALSTQDEEMYSRYQFMHNGQVEMQTSMIANQIENRFEDFINRSSAIKNSNYEDRLVAIQNRLNIICDLLNGVRADIHSKHINQTTLYSMIENSEIKTIIDCMLFCEQPESYADVDELFKRVNSLSQDSAFACVVLLKAYGYSINKASKFLDTYQIGFNENGITWGEPQNSQNEEIFIKDMQNISSVPTVNTTNLAKNEIQEIVNPINVNFDEQDEENEQQAEDNTQKESANKVLAHKNGKGGRKPETIEGWLYNKIKQMYLADENTTDEMRAQFANMSYDEQVAVLREDDKRIRNLKESIKRAIHNYENLSPEKQKEIDELSKGYHYLDKLLEEKKEDIRVKTEEQTREIRERVDEYRKELRAQKAKYDAMSEEEKVKREANRLVASVKYETGLNALTKNGKALFLSRLSTIIDEESASKVLTEDDISNIKLDALYGFISTASEVMVKKDITPYMLSTEDVKETEEYKKLTQNTEDEKEKNIEEFFSMF